MADFERTSGQESTDRYKTRGLRFQTSRARHSAGFQPNLKPPASSTLQERNLADVSVQLPEPASRNSKTSDEGGHAHHFRIETPTGPTSQGVCKGCGEERTFKNWLEDLDFATKEERRQAV